jgi:hypothetical protein
MNRLFKIARRRPHIVDFYTPFTYGVTGYRIKWAQNFDGVFAAIITSTNVGFLDDNVNRNVVDTQPTTGTDVRIVFDPTTYSIDDTKAFWLQYFPVIGGVEQTPSAPTLILPDSVLKGQGVVTIHGAAPAAATFAGSLQLDLPFLMQDFRIHNEDIANYLFVATDSSGAEQQLKPDTFPQYNTIHGSQGTLYVRGATSAGVAAAVNFSAVFTLAFPR